MALALALALVLGALAFFVLDRAGTARPATAGGDSASAPAATGPDLRSGIPLGLPGLARAREPRDSLTLVGVVLSSDGVAAADAVVAMTDGHQTRADQLGRFSIPGLHRGHYVLEANSGDTASGPARVLLRPGSAPVVLRLYEAAQLSLTVVHGAARRPVAHAQVQVRSGSYGEPLIRSAVTDADGHVAIRGLSSDSYVVTATADGFQGVEEPLPPRAGRQWSHEIELQPGAPVDGRVVDEHGQPVPGARVGVFPAAAADHFIPLSYRRAFDVSSDDSGRFVVPALAAGAFRLRAAHSSYLPAWSAVVSSDGATARHGIRIELTAGAGIEGEVLTATGEPAAYATVRVGTVDPHVDGGGAASTVCDEAGQFRIEGLAATAVDVVAMTGESSSDAVRIDLGSAGVVVDGVVIELTFDQSITGTVVDPDAKPIAGATVVCVGEPRGAIGTRPILPETTDSAGGFSCRGLAPGDYELTAMKPGGNNNTGPWQRSAGAVASAPDHHVVIMIPNDGGLKGRVRTAGGSVPASFGVELDVGGLPQGFSSEDGTFFLDGLAPRTYELVITMSGESFRTPVTIAEGGVVDIGTITLQATSIGAHLD